MAWLEKPRRPGAPVMNWEQWWAELVAIAAKHGHTPGMPELWKEYNWARGQTPQEAYLAEYSLDF